MDEPFFPLLRPTSNESRTGNRGALDLFRPARVWDQLGVQVPASARP
jgi:hypothetical protein